MSANGHVPDITTDEIAQILDEWRDAIKGAKEALHSDILKDSKSFQERELDVIVDFIIPDSFRIGAGNTPDDNEKGDDRLWNYPEFVRIIKERAGRFNITTRRLLGGAFKALIEHKPNGRVMALNILLGEEYVRRVIGDRDAVNKISKRHKPDSLDDPEESATTRELTVKR